MKLIRKENINVVEFVLFHQPLYGLSVDNDTKRERETIQIRPVSVFFTRSKILYFSCSGDGRFWKFSVNGFVRRFSRKFD